MFFCSSLVGCNCGALPISHCKHHFNSSSGIFVSVAADQYYGSTHCFTSGLNCLFVQLETVLFSRFWKSTDVQGSVNLLAVLANEEATQLEYPFHASTLSKFLPQQLSLDRSSVCSSKTEKNQLTNCQSISFTFCCVFANILYIFSC